MQNNKPYTGFYSEELREAITFMPPPALRLFILLSTYANSDGVCFPGVRELSARMTMSVEDVICWLEWLEQHQLMGYARRDEHDPITHRQLPNAYALNPALYVARSASAEVQFSLIMEATSKKPDRNSEGFSIHNQHQNPESKPTAVNQHQEPPPPTTTAKSPMNKAESETSGGADTSGVDLAASWAAMAENSEANTGRTTRKRTSATKTERSSTSKANSVSSAPPPSPSPALPVEPDDLTPFNAPFADPVYESAADALRLASGNMTHANARMMVQVYGPGQARAAVEMLKQQPAHSVNNKAGYLRTLLRRRAVTTEDLGIAPARTLSEETETQDGTKSPYISGPYGHYVDH